MLLWSKATTSTTIKTLTPGGPFLPGKSSPGSAPVESVSIKNFTGAGDGSEGRAQLRHDANLSELTCRKTPGAVLGAPTHLPASDRRHHLR